jgi:hypothetical protein
VSTSEITVQRHLRTVTVSRGGAAPVSVYRQSVRTVQLAQARGPAGADGAAGIGSNILYGAGVPAAGDGRDGDTYVDTVLGNYYRKNAGAWSLQVNLTGYPGWSPVFAVVADGNRAVFQLVDWVTGTGTVNKPPILSGGNPQYLATTGLTTNIASAFDLRGYAGWSPVFALFTDTSVNPSRSVLKLADWVSGTGTKPAILSGGNPQYVATTGFTTTLASAVDIRGATGPTDPNALAYVIALG